MKLYKNKEKKVIFGVVAGLHEILGLEKHCKLSLETTRWILIALTIITRQLLFILYLILAAILPNKSDIM